MNNEYLRIMHKNLEKVSDEICDNHQEEIDIIARAIDRQFGIILNTFEIYSTIPDITNTDFYYCMFSCIKNIYTIDSCMDQITRANIGASKGLLRQIVENMILTKTVYVYKEESIYKKWKRGKRINFKNELFSKGICCDLSNLKEYWNYLCVNNHSTLFSQLLTSDYNELEIKIALNDMKKILILFSYIVNECLLKEYIDNNDGIKNMSNELNKICISFYNSLSKTSKKIVDEFKSDWKI